MEALENCQRGFANREVEWSDISRGMKRQQPSVTDELQMQTFWRRWNELITLSQPGQILAQQEVLNWCCLVGAMAELGRRPDETTLIETWIFNSSKCFAFFRP